MPPETIYRTTALRLLLYGFVATERIIASDGTVLNAPRARFFAAAPCVLPLAAWPRALRIPA